jgi:hypothetical protein
MKIIRRRESHCDHLGFELSEAIDVLSMECPLLSLQLHLPLVVLLFRERLQLLYPLRIVYRNQEIILFHWILLLRDVSKVQSFFYFLLGI